MAVSTTNATELTAEQVQKTLVKPLEEKSIFLASGPRIFDTNGSAIRIPKLGGPTVPGWHGQNELIGEEDPTFDEVLLMPDTMKSIKVITRFSNELARQSIVALDSALQDRLVTDVATTLDTAFFAGTGDGTTTPQGMLSWAGTQSIDATSAELDLDMLLDAWGLALEADVNIASLQWFMRPANFTALRKIKDTTGQYLLQPDPTADGVFRLWGSKVSPTKRLTDGNVALADMSQVAVARDMAPTVKLLTERYADYDQQALRVIARYDVKPLNPEAVVKITNLG
ncbi:phage major capsid protein [Arthrobacter sp. MYb227]|uniref:phage major capsid protein n=1 Tax=Arthrobacter sp. MYb227 TaxID=1848601 RepID=UPI000CFCE00A|nr:phage major capsid protein [Arthrobacter sp. MYb227]PQZ85596.1 phage major capsid protein [Arthrobacter sp. MYb227]